MQYATKSANVAVPKVLARSLADFCARWEELSEQMEDFFMVADKNFVKKMSRARKQHLGGKTKPLSSLKQNLGL